MSVSNQKVVLIDKTTPPERRYFKIDHDLYFLAAERLTKMGMICYMYFMAQIPHTWDNIKNEDNKRNAPYEISTTHISEVTGISTTSAKNGIKELSDKGYLQLLRGNLYRFRDILLEDKTQTIEEHEEVLDYEQMIELSINTAKEERQTQLKNIAINHINDREKI